MNGREAKKKPAYMLLLVLFLASCAPKFEPVEFGKDACAYCKMSIVDSRYAAEIVSQKGRAYKFDDMGCLLNFMKEEIPDSKTCMVFVSDFASHPTSFLDGKKAIYLHHTFFKSPMNGNYAAFSSDASAQSLKDSLHITSDSFLKLKEDAGK